MVRSITIPMLTNETFSTYLNSASTALAQFWILVNCSHPTAQFFCPVSASNCLIVPVNVFRITTQETENEPPTKTASLTLSLLTSITTHLHCVNHSILSRNFREFWFSSMRAESRRIIPKHFSGCSMHTKEINRCAIHVKSSEVRRYYWSTPEG